MDKIKYEIVIIGVSLGGLEAVKAIIENIPGDFPLPIVIVQHRVKNADETLQMLLTDYGNLNVVEPEDKDEFEPGNIYLAPPDYHLLFEENHFAFSRDLPVNHARPSIDVLFESAADTFGNKVIGIILTGSSRDGAAGLAAIKRAGGYTIVQDTATAEADIMPKAAIEATTVDLITSLEEIGPFLKYFCI